MGSMHESGALLLQVKNKILGCIWEVKGGAGIALRI